MVICPFGANSCSFARACCGHSTIEALCAEDRELLSRRWLDRAHNELSTSTTFAELYRGLVALEASSDLLAVAAAAIGDELRHAVICHAVAERYAGHVHGCLGFVALRRVFMDAVANFILPGFDHAGIPTGQARTALAKQPWTRA
jgi:hypothetical protein